jgi:hypothetical protein
MTVFTGSKPHSSSPTLVEKFEIYMLCRNNCGQTAVPITIGTSTASPKAPVVLYEHKVVAAHRRAIIVRLGADAHPAKLTREDGKPTFAASCAHGRYLSAECGHGF